MKLKILMIVILLTVLTGCASEGLKSPCDESGHFCGSKIKINHW